MPGYDQDQTEVPQQETCHSGHEGRPVAAASGNGVRKFTWKELSKLNRRHNAHVAYRGKVRLQTQSLSVDNIVREHVLLLLCCCC